MEQGFWNTIKRPIVCLAPMADVTDAAFRYMITKYSKYGGQDIGAYGAPAPTVPATGGPDITWTEFVSADGLFLGGKSALMRDLLYTEAERPVVAQFFSPDPARMKRAAELAVELGFDGIDINMGCPDRSICKQGAGAALIRTPDRAREVIEATVEGAGTVPVSVKTRAGYASDDELDTWMELLLDMDLAAVTLHARTRNDMSKVPARWELVRRAVELRDRRKSKTLIIGNGDVMSVHDALERVAYSGADGVMIGRGIFGNPWLFADLPRAKQGGCGPYTPTIEERLRVMVEHTALFEELLGHHKSFALMKKHYKAYVSGWDGSKELRSRLMEAESAAEVEAVVDRYLLSKNLTE